MRRSIEGVTFSSFWIENVMPVFPSKTRTIKGVRVDEVSVMDLVCGLNPVSADIAIDVSVRMPTVEGVKNKAAVEPGLQT